MLKFLQHLLLLNESVIWGLASLLLWVGVHGFHHKHGILVLNAEILSIPTSHVGKHDMVNEHIKNYGSDNRIDQKIDELVRSPV